MSYCELSRPDKYVLRRTVSGGRTAPPDTLRHRPDTERTCWRSGRLNSHRYTRDDKTVLSVSCLGGGVNWTIAINVFRLLIFLSATVLSCRESNSHGRNGRDREHGFVVSGVEVWISFKGAEGLIALDGAGKGAQNSLTKNISRLTITKVSTTKFAEWAKSSLSQQTFAIRGCQVDNLFTH